MISIGNNKTKGLSLGQGKIKKAFLGSKVVWTKELVIYTKINNYEKERGDTAIYFDTNAPNYHWQEETAKYIIIDGRYKAYRDEFDLYMGAIRLKDNSPLINMAFPIGTKIVMVFEAE